MNDGLRLKFLDLKDSAIVISLNPFKPPTRKINERNVCLIYTVSMALSDAFLRWATQAVFLRCSRRTTTPGVSHGVATAASITFIELIDGSSRRTREKAHHHAQRGVRVLGDNYLIWDYQRNPLLCFISYITRIPMRIILAVILA